MRCVMTMNARGKLRIVERKLPTLGEGELLVRASRAGINFSDLAGRVGLYPDAPPFPFVSGYEVAGTVAERGPGVQGFSVGDRVFGLARFGGHATHVVVAAKMARRCPDTLSDDAAASLPVVYLTAHYITSRVAPLRPGMRILIHMAAGGVGLALLQLVRDVPGLVSFGTASAEKHDFLRSKGLTVPIDRRTEDYAKVVRDHGPGLDRVFDPLGGGDWAKGFELLGPGGLLVAYGWANMVRGESRNLLHVGREWMRMPRLNPLMLMSQNRGVTGVNLGHLWKEDSLIAEGLDALVELAAAGKLAPHIHAVFPLDKAEEAYRLIAQRGNVGKVLLDCT